MMKKATYGKQRARGFKKNRTMNMNMMMMMRRSCIIKYARKGESWPGPLAATVTTFL